MVAMQVVTSCEFVQKSNQPSNMIEGDVKTSLSTMPAMDMMGLSWIFFEEDDW